MFARLIIAMFCFIQFILVVDFMCLENHMWDEENLGCVRENRQKNKQYWLPSLVRQHSTDGESKLTPLEISDSDSYSVDCYYFSQLDIQNAL